MSDANTTLRPESPLNKKTRERGYYWVKYDSGWEIMLYEQGDWYWARSISYLDDGDLEEIDEHRITREEPIAAKISGTTERTPQNE